MPEREDQRASRAPSRPATAAAAAAAIRAGRRPACCPAACLPLQPHGQGQDSESPAGWAWGPERQKRRRPGRGPAWAGGAAWSRRARRAPVGDLRAAGERGQEPPGRGGAACAGPAGLRAAWAGALAAAEEEAPCGGRFLRPGASCSRPGPPRCCCCGGGLPARRGVSFSSRRSFRFPLPPPAALSAGREPPSARGRSACWRRVSWRSRRSRFLRWLLDSSPASAPFRSAAGFVGTGLAAWTVAGVFPAELAATCVVGVVGAGPAGREAGPSAGRGAAAEGTVAGAACTSTGPGGPPASFSSPAAAASTGPAASAGLPTGPAAAAAAAAAALAALRCRWRLLSRGGSAPAPAPAAAGAPGGLDTRGSRAFPRPPLPSLLPAPAVSPGPPASRPGPAAAFCWRGGRGCPGPAMEGGTGRAGGLPPGAGLPGVGAAAAGPSCGALPSRFLSRRGLLPLLLLLLLLVLLLLRMLVLALLVRLQSLPRGLAAVLLRHSSLAQQHRHQPKRRQQKR